jgi:hypothetical protein
MELQPLDLASSVSLILGLVLTALNILYILFRYPREYLRDRYLRAQERKNKFYGALIEDVSAIAGDLEAYRDHQGLRGLEDKHLSLLICNKTRMKVKELMKALNKLERAYSDLKCHVYPQVLKDVEYKLKEVERMYFTGLGIVRPSDGPGPFIEGLKEPDSLRYFLRCADTGEDVKLTEFPTFQGLLSNIERAHVNRGLEGLLNTILNHLKESYVFARVMKLRRKCLKLSKVVRELLEREARRLSSRPLGIIYGPGDLRLLDDYVKRRGKSY